MKRKWTTNHNINVHSTNAFNLQSRIIIVGSGPSLKKLKLRTDIKECTVVALNGSYISLLELGIKPDYVVIEDYRAYNLFAPQAVEEKINLILASDLPNTYEGKRVYFQRNYGFPFLYGTPKWGNIKKSYYGGTVAYFALQVFAQGKMERLDLYGLDMSYKKITDSVVVGNIEIIFNNNSYENPSYNSRIIRRYEDPEVVTSNMIKSLQFGLSQLEDTEISNFTSYPWML